MNRCSWVNLGNEKYIKYHDEEWGIPKYKDQELWELLILEIFQAGLSWETILNKRDNFRLAFDNFKLDKIIKYDEVKINDLMHKEGIVRNLSKIKAVINNAKVFQKIQKEYGSFSNYIWSFTNKKVIYGEYKTFNEVSERISKDLKNKGMVFVGKTIIYAYLQAIGIINDHEKGCFKALN